MRTAASKLLFSHWTSGSTCQSIVLRIMIRRAPEIPVDTVTSTVPLILGQPVWPAIPRSGDDLRVPHAVIGDLILRFSWLHGSASLTSLQKALKLPFDVL